MLLRYIFAAFIFAVPLGAVTPGIPELPSFRDTVRRIKESVVNISTVKNVKADVPVFGGDPFSQFERFFGDGDGASGGDNGGGGEEQQQTFQTQSLGSGVIIDAQKGYILTNNHVVDGADEIKVKFFDGRVMDGQIVGRDSKTDLAVVKVKGASGLSAAVFGDSDAMEVGDWVLAVGSPFGLEQTVSHGIISAKGRVIGEGPYDDFLQTDAPINPGNSGGPLVNLSGEVVEINTAISSRSGGSEGIGFAIPSNMAKKIYVNLVTNGKVTRGWLGVQIQDLEPALATYFGLPGGAMGAVVASVMPTGPAHDAGVRAGDVITEFDGHAVEDVRSLQMHVAEAPVGEPVTMKVWRNRASKTLSIKIGNMADFDADAPKASEEKSKVKLGLVVRAENPSEMSSDPSERGVVVQEVEPGSPADQAGIQPGDIVTEFNRQSVTSPEQFASLARKMKDEATVVIRVKRGDSSLYLPLTLSPQK